ncbi:MAG: hypothetical protein KBA53_09360 [Thermoclostridium sp.]|nr:hypothetical protein [Thermoclostridium sp.]
MNNWLRIPGFPSPEQQDIVRFHLFKKLPYTTRMIIYLTLLVIGFVLQLVFLRVMPGAIALFIAVLLTLVRGYNSKVDLNAYRANSSWTQVNLEKLREVDEFNQKLTKWDKDGLDISNGTGFLLFLLFIIALFFASMFLRFLDVSESVRNIFVVDALILILPIWFNGMRKIKKQELLCMKTNLVTNMEGFFQTIRRDGEHFKPALMLAKDKTDKSIPTDCRFTISFDGMPADFYGIQAQINLNDVQGTYYPYFYCVLAAKKGFGLERISKMVPVPKSIILKYEIDDAEVIVIRQYTTKTSGYHTKFNSCKAILDRALFAARLIMDPKQQG